MSDTKRTALHDIHKRLGARMVPFGGWVMPVEYTSISKEHTAVRTRAGLFDVSHMGEFFVRGPAALDLLQFVTTNDVSALDDGQAQYSALAYPEGTVVDDLLVYRIDPENYMLVVNASNIGKDFEWVASHNRSAATLEDASDRTTLLALQGPQSGDVMAKLVDHPPGNIAYYRFRTETVAGVSGLLSRTGYTGEDGFEFYFPRAESESVWTAIMEAGAHLGVLPAGLGARNTLRLEAKLLLYGNDIDERTSLIEAGLGWIVKLDKGDFVGRETLARQKESGVARKLVGFETLDRTAIARDHYPVEIDGREVGQVTSGGPAITLGKNIGLTYLPTEHAVRGTRFQVRIRKRLVDAEVVPTPFYKRRRSE